MCEFTYLQNFVHPVGIVVFLLFRDVNNISYYACFYMMRNQDQFVIFLTAFEST